MKYILPALTEATSPYWRPIKYSWFPPLGLATLATFLTPDDRKHQARHVFYAAGWRKFEPLWNFMIRAGQLGCMTPVLEAVLSKADAAIVGPQLTRAGPGEPASLLPRL